MGPQLQESIMANIEIVNDTSENTISIDLTRLTVTQIVRFPSGNFYKHTSKPLPTLEEARSWARFLS